tara:strand:+ start:760 stop:1425 length:666 start_codon:yes stop_codon:yes gene_type:complete
MSLFELKKKEVPPPAEAAPFPTDLPPGFPQGQQAPQSNLPVDQINNLRSQGLSDNQIIQNLQRDGFTSDQVFEAMTQSGMQAAGPLPPDQAPQGAAPMPMEMSPQMPMMGGDKEHIEEVAEAIVNEKWEEMVKSLNKIVEWKEHTDTTIKKMEQQMVDLKQEFGNLHKALIGKISDYDQNILNVGTEIKALEKVFQKVLPTFTSNVSELDRITKKLKSPKK